MPTRQQNHRRDSLPTRFATRSRLGYYSVWVNVTRLSIFRRAVSYYTTVSAATNSGAPHYRLLQLSLQRRSRRFLRPSLLLPRRRLHAQPGGACFQLRVSTCSLLHFHFLLSQPPRRPLLRCRQYFPVMPLPFLRQRPPQLFLLKRKQSEIFFKKTKSPLLFLHKFHLGFPNPYLGLKELVNFFTVLFDLRGKIIGDKNRGRERNKTSIILRRRRRRWMMVKVERLVTGEQPESGRNDIGRMVMVMKLRKINNLRLKTERIDCGR